MSITIPPMAGTLVQQIEARQAELGLTDQQLCEALGFERGITLVLIKQGTMKLPINKVPALAAVLALPRGAMSDAFPPRPPSRSEGRASGDLVPLSRGAADTRHRRELPGGSASPTSCGPPLHHGKQWRRELKRREIRAEPV